MQSLDLYRISTDSLCGTFGVLKWREAQAPFAVSLEDPWRNNQRNVSCIPSGVYQCQPRVSPTHGSTYEVRDVPGRTHILFHKGNTHINTQGCILVAESYTVFEGGLPGVGNSGAGFSEFMSYARDVLDYAPFMLEIHWGLPHGVAMIDRNVGK